MIPILDNIKEYLHIESLTSEYDNFLSTLMCGTDKLIKGYLGNEIELTDYSLEFSPEFYYTEKALPFIKVNSITSFKERVKPTDTWTTIAATEYELLTKPNRLYYDSFKIGYYYQINMSVGYTTALLPDDLIQCATEITVIKFKESDRRAGKLEGRLGLSAINVQSAAGTTQTTFSDVWEKWKRELRHYRIIATGSY